MLATKLVNRLLDNDHKYSIKIVMVQPFYIPSLIEIHAWDHVNKDKY